MSTRYRRVRIRVILEIYPRLILEADLVYIFTNETNLAAAKEMIPAEILEDLEKRFVATQVRRKLSMGKCTTHLAFYDLETL